MYARSESRQQPGYACEECRKKKLRCDRQRPHCGACIIAGVACRVIDRRMPRGPKKGSFEALRNRIGELERHLSSIQTSSAITAEPVQDLEEFEVLNWEASDEGQNARLSVSSSSTTRDPQSALATPTFSNATSTKASPTQSLPSYHTSVCDDLQISDLMKADLTQLYFDRVHPVVPMLNQARVAQFSRDSRAMNEYRQCLQFAMWTVAITFSSQFGHLREPMYSRTRALLEALDNKESDMRTCPIEQVQSWILLTFYEFTKCSYRRAWLSAGRVFRLVHLARLHNLDNPKFQSISELEMDSIGKEEKRRTFWVAYCLDRFISVSNGAPMTLLEEVVCTRLPCPDIEFVNGPLTPGPFLSEVMASADPRAYSPLAECIILVTICGRALVHKQVTDVEALYGNSPIEFALRHDWLDSLLVTRMNSLEVNYPRASLASDPMTMFAHLVARTAIIYLCHIMEPLSNDIQTSPLVWSQQDRGVVAAQEISRLAGELEHLGYFKAHTFTPLPIYLSAAKLRSHIERRKSQLQSSPGLMRELEESLQASLDALRKLGSVNNLATYYLELVKANKTSEICFRLE